MSGARSVSLAYPVPGMYNIIVGRDAPHPEYRISNGGVVVRALFRSKWLLLLLTPILVLGCDENPVTELENIGERPPEADIIVPDLEHFITFDFGQTVYVESEKLWITFTDVIGDSRCPMEAYCFWPGSAEIELTLETRRTGREIVVLALEGGRDPYLDPEMFECACGYRIYFLALGPYPSVGKTYPDESYTAMIALEPDADCCPEGEICFTWVNPFLLQRDPYALNGVSIEGDELTMDVTYSGGCWEHRFKLYMNPVFTGSDPARAKLYLSHEDWDDPCDALIFEELTFDIGRIAELYFEQYGSYDDIVLEVFGYFTDQPGDGFEVVYSP
jgi:hypothetical protein